MSKTLALSAVQAIFLVVLAPFITGFIKKTKAWMQTRRGPSMFQPYRDLVKYFGKESVISEHTSWIFRATPLVFCSTMLVVSLIIPVLSTGGALNFTGDLLLVIYLFALARFFLTLAGLDAGSAFGGMASSREMTISSIAEPAVMLPLFVMALQQGTTNLSAITAGVAAAGPVLILGPTHLLSMVALFIAAIAETGRIPVDNPDTHLELTMVHEGMLLEYSGKDLALLTIGASLKQLLIFSLIANVFFPWGIAQGTDLGSLIIAGLVFVLKVMLVGAIMAVIETSFAKMRLFKVPDLLIGSFLLSLLGLISKFMLRG